MPTTDAQTTDALVREMVRKRHRRRRTTLVSLTAVLVVAAAAAIGVGLTNAAKSDVGEPPSRVPAGVADDKSGVALSAGSVQVDLYLDYLCPECRHTERALASELAAMETDGRVRVHYHPVTFLDDYSNPSGYSTRAAAAAACAADEGKFAQYSAVLFERQPAERGPGLSEADLVAAGREVGITETSFADCVRNGRYVPWVDYVSEVAASRDVASTPTVMVAGRRVDVTGSDQVAAFVGAVTEAAR